MNFNQAVLNQARNFEANGVGTNVNGGEGWHSPVVYSRSSRDWRDAVQQLEPAMLKTYSSERIQATATCALSTAVSDASDFGPREAGCSNPEMAFRAATRALPARLKRARVRFSSRETSGESCTPPKSAAARSVNFNMSCHCPISSCACFSSVMKSSARGEP